MVRKEPARANGVNLRLDCCLPSWRLGKAAGTGTGVANKQTLAQAAFGIVYVGLGFSSEAVSPVVSFP